MLFNLILANCGQMIQYKRIFAYETHETYENILELQFFRVFRMFRGQKKVVTIHKIVTSFFLFDFNPPAIADGSDLFLFVNNNANKASFKNQIHHPRFG